MEIRILKKPTTMAQKASKTQQLAPHAPSNAPLGLKLKDMDEKNMHNLFLKNMSGLIEVAKNPGTGATANP